MLATTGALLVGLAVIASHSKRVRSAIRRSRHVDDKSRGLDSAETQTRTGPIRHHGTLIDRNLRAVSSSLA